MKTAVLSIPKQLVQKVAIALLGSLFLSVMSHISCPLPFTFVPFTMQTMALFLLSGIFGSAHAVRAVLCYLLEGSVGLPVFSGAAISPLWFLGPKAGFLLSFVLAAFVVGKLIEKRKNCSFAYLLLSLAVGQLIIFSIGMIWLSFFVGTHKAFLFGVLPFIFGATAKIIASALIIRGVR